jgi:hypothetical protein
LFLKLAFAAILGGLILIANPSMGMFWQGLALIGVGGLSMVFAVRGIRRREPGSRRAEQGPTFTADDPEVAALPPTTTTRLREQVQQARERRKRAQE